MNIDGLLADHTASSWPSQFGLLVQFSEYIYWPLELFERILFGKFPFDLGERTTSNSYKYRMQLTTTIAMPSNTSL